MKTLNDLRQAIINSNNVKSTMHFSNFIPSDESDMSSPSAVINNINNTSVDHHVVSNGPQDQCTSLSDAGHAGMPSTVHSTLHSDDCDSSLLSAVINNIRDNSVTHHVMSKGPQDSGMPYLVSSVPSSVHSTVNSDPHLTSMGHMLRGHNGRFANKFKKPVRHLERHKSLIQGKCDKKAHRVTDKATYTPRA